MDQGHAPAAPLWGNQPGHRGEGRRSAHLHTRVERSVVRGKNGSAVGAHQAAGAAGEHGQGRTLEGGGETGPSFLH
jgi:hypothetical protein